MKLVLLLHAGLDSSSKTFQQLLLTPRIEKSHGTDG
jgi:hypothetical protein